MIFENNMKGQNINSAYTQVQKTAKGLETRPLVLKSYDCGLFFSYKCQFLKFEDN